MRSTNSKATSKAISYIAIFCLLFSLTLVRNGRLWGHELADKAQPSDSTVYVNESGQTVINTTSPGKDITGYAGPVPLKIYVSDSRIDSIVPLHNDETPAFFSRLIAAGLDRSWNGLTVAEAKALEVDAASGATYSSNAFIGNVRAGLAKLPDQPLMTAEKAENSNLKTICLLIVLLCGALLPLFVKGKIYRTIQQLLNVAILGFWGGIFIDYAIIFNFIGNGIMMSLSSLLTVLLLVIGFIYPLFGKHNYYCSWICPFGSLQDLAGSCVSKKVRIGEKTLKWLVYFRKGLWVTLMALLFIGWGSQWVDYEIFTMFIVQNASVAVLSIGMAFVLLSIFIPRPFCRFVCPTGSLLKEL